MKTVRLSPSVPLAALALFGLALSAGTNGPPVNSFRFAVLGDRTGEAVPGVFEQVWRDIGADRPALVVSVGDLIQGGNDATAPAEWQAVEQQLAPYRRRFRLFLTPGNHDVWSARSQRLFEQIAGCSLHYGFDWAATHFTVLDNSRTETLATTELAFLEQDLAQHRAAALKIVVSHRPSWLLAAALGDASNPFHQLCKRFGVRCVIAGHLHELLHFQLEGIDYVSAPSSGGHLRNDKSYEHGWFFGHLLAAVSGPAVAWQVLETGPPYGAARHSTLAQWGVAGLVGSQ